MIIRPRYLDILRTYRNVPLVKILAGIRRSGKSTILEMLGEELVSSGIPRDHIISR
ncbi:MAG: ATPase, partial [Clostridia bacterium]